MGERDRGKERSPAITSERESEGERDYLQLPEKERRREQDAQWLCGRVKFIDE